MKPLQDTKLLPPPTHTMSVESLSTLNLDDQRLELTEETDTLVDVEDLTNGVEVDSLNVVAVDKVGKVLLEVGALEHLRTHDLPTSTQIRTSTSHHDKFNEIDAVPYLEFVLASRF